jgi:hypothetical protein
MDRRFLLAGIVVAAGLGVAAWLAQERGAPTSTIAPRVRAADSPEPAAASEPPAPAPMATAPRTAPPPDVEPPLRRMENRFIADPLAPEWARRHEKVVTDFLAEANLRGLNLQVPLRQSVECHSTLCRISVLLPDIDAAAQVHERMVLSIGEALPTAQAFTVIHDDGRAELITFAGDERMLQR